MGEDIAVRGIERGPVWTEHAKLRAVVWNGGGGRQRPVEEVWISLKVQ